MKKIALILALVICLAMIASCAAGSGDTPTEATTEKPEEVTTAPLDDDVVTTAAEEEPGEEEPPVEIDYGTPNNKEEGKDYHLESLKIPTNSQNLDEQAGVLIENTAQCNADYRYCDGFGYVIYEIDISEMIEPTVEIKVLQNYLVKISAYNDYDYYKTIADFSEESPTTWRDGGNDIEIVIDPYEHGFYKTLYIMIEDTDPTDGWGGTIRYLTIKQFVEGAGEDILTTYGE